MAPTKLWQWLTGLTEKSLDGSEEVYINDTGGSKKTTTQSIANLNNGVFAPVANGVTNGDSHDHSGGDGAQIGYSTLSGLPTLGTAAAAATGDFEAAGSVATHAVVTSSVHGISAFGATLVDDADASTARGTLGLSTAATTASTDYATAAQGGLADSAMQPGDDAADLGSGAATDGYVATADGAGNVAWEAVPDAYAGAASEIHAATSKSTPVDADEIGLIDSAASWVLKKLTWANLKTALSSMFLVSDTTGITGADRITNIVSLTQVEYDAIVTKSTTTIYIIIG